MNILFISQLYPLSEKSENSFALHYFVKEWSRHHNVRVIRPYLPMEKETCPPDSNVNMDSVSVDIVRPLWIPVLKKAVVSKKNIIRLIDKKPDVIICHLYNSYLTFSFLKEHFNVPFVVGIHQSDARLAKNLFHRIRIKKATGKADMVAYRSLAVKRNFECYVPQVADTYIAWSGIPEKLTENARQLLKTDKKTGGTRKFISVCRLLKLKQIDKVIISLNELKQKEYKWEYVIIGEGPERKNLEQLVQKFGLENQIHFPGKLPREKVFQQMLKSDFFVMPSYNETFGLAYLEAMANGCVVLGSKGWGVDGIVENGKNGFLVNPENDREILHAIQNLLNLKDKDVNLILKNSLKTVSRFSEKNMASDYLNKIMLHMKH